MAVAVASKTKNCKTKCKDDTGKQYECGTSIPSGSSECSNRKKHINPFKTGLCSSGFHEGTRAHDASGKPAKVCEAWQMCPCSCHANLDTLFSMSGQSRAPQGNPEYVPVRNTYWVPTAEELIKMRAETTDARKPKLVIVKSTDPEKLPDRVVRDFQPTPTGRSARGELTALVQECTDQWVEFGIPRECTPQHIATWIEGRRGDGRKQSSGAVSAVLANWEAVGFATLGKKPARFLGYTPEGIKLGYEAMRLKARDEERRTVSKANRGIRGS